jgi:NAD(P)H-hydrate epimerase
MQNKKDVGLKVIKEIFSSRKKDSHKGDNGKVLIIGGSEEYVGAAALAGLSALRAGCDIVTIAAPKKVAWAINCLSPDLMTHKVDCGYFTKKNTNNIIKLAEQFDVVLIGNGIGLKSKEFVKEIVKKIEKPLVIDADAIKSISIDDAKNSIITPHKKELEILLHNSGHGKMIKTSNRKELIKRLQRIIGTNILLIKGKTDIILSKDKCVFNHTGNEGMTKGGTGDVLAGLSAGFLAQSKDLMKSAEAAAFINGYIGDLLIKRKKGPVFLASDIVKEIKRVLGQKGA